MFPLLLLCVILVGDAVAKEDYRGHRLITMQATTKAQLELLAGLHDNDDLGLDFWSDPSLVIPTTIRVPPQSFGRVRSTLRLAGMTPEVVIEDVQSIVDKEAESMAQSRSRRVKSLQDYHTYYLTQPEVEDKLFEFADAYPYTMKLWTAGKSHENRDLLFAEISNELGDETKPIIWIEATTHAREWITTAVALYLIEGLASGQMSGAAKMLNDFDWFIMPVHNPDGYHYTHTNTRLWRKNRRVNSGGSCRNYYGVDLNRNWDANWGGTGSSGSCSSDTYRGTAPLSEPETLALHNAMQQSAGTNNRVKAFFSLHCYSQLLLLPFAYGTRSADFDELLEIGKAAMDSLYQRHEKWFQTGAAHEILYAASGGAYDHAKVSLGIKYSYTYELRPSSSSEGGFIIPPEQIKPAMEEVWDSMATFADLINKNLN